ncbi:MAG: asparaginase [Clostridia bacterium]|nr:asparaginase [Clostridia bacterium]
MQRKKVLIIYTGGTIGMKKGENGYTPASLETLTEAISSIKDIHHEKMPEFTLIQTLPILDSSNVGLREWNKIARLIYESYEEYDGFVVLHGTDTMAYTASALSFMLRNIAKPVVLTGSQIPLLEIRSDGADNLITSMLVASEGVVKEVCLCFGDRLLRGNRATKMSADGLVAFDSPNLAHLAEIGIEIKYNFGVIAPTPTTPLEFTEFKNSKIAVLKVFPGIQLSLFESILTESLSGIVLESFGTGNIPDTDGELLYIIKKAFDHGIPVVVTSQCPSGTVSLGAYETSSPLKRAGAISGRDMTTEAAVAKLYYLFSKDRTPKEREEIMSHSLVGELTEITKM